MKILLTGGLGFIGSHTALSLIEKGYKDIVILDNLSNSKINVIDKLKQISGIDIQFIKGDVCSADDLNKIFSEYRFDLVIHFAGKKAVGESVEIPMDYYETNFIGSLNLIKHMSQYEVNNLIFSSSCTVYGNPQYLPIDENHPLSPTNPYGRSKLFAEKLFEDVVNSKENFNVISLRYFNPVGAHHSGIIGEDPNGIPNNLVPFVAKVALGEFDEVKVFGNDYDTIDGSGIRDYIHIEDLAEGHVAAVSSINKMSPGFHVINLGTGKGYSVLELIDEYRNVSKQNIPHAFVARRDGDIAEIYAKVNLSRELLNWSTSRGLNEMCSSSWLYNLNQQEKE